MTEPVYKSIRDVANIIGVETHTLRFWEKKFPYLNPKKIGGHNRFYSADDVAYLQQIYHFLKDEGYTTQGVLKLIKLHGVKAFREGKVGNNIADESNINARTRMGDSHEKSVFNTNDSPEIPHIKNINVQKTQTKAQTLITDVENILAKLQKLRNML